jgi:hypothetical protein
VFVELEEECLGGRGGIDDSVEGKRRVRGDYLDERCRSEALGNVFFACEIWMRLEGKWGVGGDRPRGCPSLARAEGLANTGIEEWKPRMVVEGLQRETGRMTRGWKKKRENARAFSVFAVGGCERVGERVR